MDKMISDNMRENRREKGMRIPVRNNLIMSWSEEYESGMQGYL